MSLKRKEKIHKLIGKVNTLLQKIHEQERNFVVRKNIDQYYYIQKKEELELLCAIYNQTHIGWPVLQQNYEEVYCHWKKDARWLNKYIATSRSTNPRSVL